MAKTKAAPVEGTDAAPARRPQLVEIPTGELKPWPGLNPRTHFDEAQIEELAASLRKSGMLEPILVHRRDGDEWSEGLIIAGERRWRAAVRADLASVPCLVREYTEEEALDIAIVENAQRSDLSPVEEARGFRTWLSAGAGRKVQDLAERIGKSQPFVSNRIRLLDLPPEILDLVEEDLLPIGLARDLLLPFARIPEKKRVQLFDGFAKWMRAVKAPPTPDLIRREIGGRAARLSRQIEAHEGVYGVDTVHPIFDAKLHKSCSCGGPTFEYSYNPVVRCFDESWWDARQAEAKAAQKADAEKRKAAVEAAGSAAAQEHFAHQDGLRKKYGWDKAVRVYGSEFLDPAKLAGARWATVGEGREPYCLDPAKLSAAKAAVTREVQKRLKEIRDELAPRLLDEALAVREVDTSLLRFLLNRTHDRTELKAAGTQLGLDLPTHAREDDLVKVPDAQLVPLARLVQLRNESGAWKQYSNPHEDRIQKELGREYQPALEALLASVRAVPAAPEKKGRAGKAKKVPAAEVETPRQQLDLRFEHVREAIAAVKDAGGAEALATMPDAEGNPLSTLARRVMSLQDFIAEHGAVPMHEAEGDELTYSINDLSILAEAEALLQPAEVCA